uniref:Zinc transporter 1 n=1 Tax=Ditylenchus dipsaci TaxID=166011 RepID=A0A915DRH1_9BILA
MLMFHSHSHSHISSRGSDIHSGHKDTIEELESKHLIGSHQDRAMAMAELDAAEDSLMTGDSQRKRPAGHADQLNMRGVFLHIVSDAIGSVIVIATALVSWLVPGQEELKLYMDPALSIILVFQEDSSNMLQTTPKFIDIEKIKEDLCNMDGIVAVHEFHVWRWVGERIIATVHIRFLSLKHYLLAAERIRALFHDNHIHSATVQPEFSDLESSSGSENDCNYACLPDALWQNQRSRAAQQQIKKKV